jgi:hypothetical protein
MNPTAFVVLSSVSDVKRSKPAARAEVRHFFEYFLCNFLTLQKKSYDFYGHGLAAGSDSIFQAFLGIPSRPEQGYSYSQKSMSKYNMPDAYIGRNEYIRDTIEDLAITAKWDWVRLFNPARNISF